MNIVPVQIRPHLIPFFYKEFEGVEVNHLSKKVKACKVNSESALGFMIMLSLQKCKFPVKTTGKFYVYLEISPAIFSESKLFNIANGKNSFLEVPPYLNNKINEILEDIFRIAFQYQTRGMLKANPNLLVRDAIIEFMNEYQLDEYGFQVESIRRLLDRGQKNKLSRLQSKVANRVLNI
ncbi:hypothetical protein LIT13_01245 [Flavobacterium psychrophilum]|uniref:Uncharacterized protein n=6 Tax=root TaxID=1 RepID=A6GXU0_FLAPJ|nr:hypothetical protein [Flavobacterium psychrophilum]YP_008320454.1 hypothetical protein N375_gp40 [Flavobacterium phage 6H]YP_009321855.1 hypothetical protein BOX11_gp34 [Flavobacterium phage 1H]YP_009322912.1 hypothetical protein BOX10_gp40 [Flavobacterium phage 2A]YP_009592347.1 hypothetical protein FDG69_gp39 [Flavobacterium phage 23T]QCW20044.1 hypothetical protein [Flavobacterium phage FPSV-D15]QCW20199.1 hypothetical protein [Flavobacterium phage FPSV-F7]QCW20766.1 hypothetical prote